MIWLLIFVIGLIAVLYWAVEYNFNNVVTRKVCSVDEMYEYQYNRGLADKEKYKNLKKEKVLLKTNEGFNLNGIYIEGDKNLNRTIIFVHGITVGIPWSLKYIDMFIKRGWNVLMYDQRRHGYSEGKYSTYGFYEKNDLDLWVNWVRNRSGNDCLIGLHGESMGAATVLQYVQINKYAKFIIADCAYSNLNELLKYHLKKQFYLPPFPLLYLTDFRVRRKAKFKFKDVSPIDSIRNVEIPIMFIHGKEDKFVPTYMSEEMYKVKRGIKKLYIAEGAAHAKSIEVNKERYEKEVMDFIDKAINV